MKPFIRDMFRLLLYLLSRLVPALVPAGAVVLALTSFDANALTLFVSPHGSDERSGASPDDALKTAERAFHLALSRATTEREIFVNFLPGTYRRITINIDSMSGFDGKLTLNGHTETGRAVFDGKHGSATWLRVKGKRGWKARLHINGFRVVGYRKAIVFQADKHDRQMWHSGHQITNNFFQDVGQFDEKVLPSIAAIHLLNTSYSVIKGNAFLSILNIKACDGLHAIYLTGGSSFNRIEGNIFDHGCGDTIKVRNRSDSNVIVGNDFRRQRAKSLLVDSYCDAEISERCADKVQECPSWNNSFLANRIDAESRENTRFVTRQVGRNVVAGCRSGRPEDRILTYAK